MATKHICALLCAVTLLVPSYIVHAETLTRDNIDEIAPDFIEVLQGMSNALSAMKNTEQREQMILAHIGTELPALSAQVTYLGSAHLTNEDVALETVSQQLAHYNEEIQTVVTNRKTRETALDTMVETLKQIGNIFGDIA